MLLKLVVMTFDIRNIKDKKYMDVRELDDKFLISTNDEQFYMRFSHLNGNYIDDSHIKSISDFYSKYY